VTIQEIALFLFVQHLEAIDCLGVLAHGKTKLGYVAPRGHRVYKGRAHALRFVQSAVEFARLLGLLVGPNDSWPPLGSGVCVLPLGPREACRAMRPEGG